MICSPAETDGDLLDLLRRILTEETPDHGAVRLRALAALEGYADLPRGAELERIAGLAGLARSTAYRVRKGDSGDTLQTDPMTWDEVPPEQQATALEPESALTGVTIGPTALYRYYDANDLLLYVGISERLLIRMGSHVEGSSWMDFAVRSIIERFPSRDEALDAEEAAIKAERPLFNHQHNSTPEARRRLVEYLVAHGRPDLLAPAVSRG